MKTNIAKVMKKADASLSLIAGNLVAGKYQTRAELRKIKTSVDNALSLSSKAFVALLKPVKVGRKGLAQIANDEFDKEVTDVAQAQIKAQILSKVIDAELEDLGEEPSDEILDNEDFGLDDADLEEDKAAEPAEDGSEPKDKVAPIVENVVTPVVENLVPPAVEDLVAPAVENIVVPAVEKVVDEVTDEIKDDEGETADLDVEEDLDLGVENDGLDDIDTDDLSQGEDTLDEFFEDEAVEPIDTGVAQAKAAKRAAVKAARKKIVVNKGSQMSLLESVFDFK